MLDILLNPSWIGSSGRLVNRIRRFAFATVSALDRRLMINLTWLSPSHSSRASMTRSIGDDDLSSWLDKGPKISFSNCSTRPFSAIRGCASRACAICGLTKATCRASWAAIVVKNLDALPRSPWFCLKKKLAPRLAPSWLTLENSLATVLDIVD